MAVVGVGVAPVGVGCRGATPPKELDSDVPSGGGQAARRGIGIGTECRRGVPEFRAGPGVSPGGSGGTPGNRHRDGLQTGCPGIPRRPGSAARADGIRFGRKGTAEPSGRGASSRRRFCRRSSSTRRCWSRFQGRRASVSASKIRPGPGSAVEDDVRTRIPSAPAPLRHRDSAHEGPPSRSSTARVVLPYPIPPTGLGGVRSSERRPASPPPTRKTSDLPPGIGISIGPPILTSTKQQNILGKHDPK